MSARRNSFSASVARNSRSQPVAARRRCSVVNVGSTSPDSIRVTVLAVTPTARRAKALALKPTACRRSARSSAGDAKVCCINAIYSGSEREASRRGIKKGAGSARAPARPARCARVRHTGQENASGVLEGRSSNGPRPCAVTQIGTGMWTHHADADVHQHAPADRRPGRSGYQRAGGCRGSACTSRRSRSSGPSTSQFSMSSLACSRVGPRFENSSTTGGTMAAIVRPTTARDASAAPVAGP